VVLLAVEEEDRRAIGRIADDGEGDDGHQWTLTQPPHLTDVEGSRLDELAVSYHEAMKGLGTLHLVPRRRESNV
jgi:hypothetical protein